MVMWTGTIEGRVYGVSGKFGCKEAPHLNNKYKRYINVLYYLTYARIH